MRLIYLDKLNNNERVFGAIPVNNKKYVKMSDCGATVYPLKCVTVKKEVNK